MPRGPDPSKTEYIFIDAWYSRETDKSNVAISRTWRQPKAKPCHYNPTRASLDRLATWVRASGADVRPWWNHIGWAAVLTIEPTQEENDA